MSPLTWNREMFLRLKEELAKQPQGQGNWQFHFHPEPPKPLWAQMMHRNSKPSKAVYLVFTVNEARQKIAELAPEFDIPEEPAREYREGVEGQ